MAIPWSIVAKKGVQVACAVEQANDLRTASHGTIENQVAGPPCVCVAVMTMLANGMPVFSLARFRARSVSSRGTEQGSLPTNTTRVSPCDSTMALAKSGSWTPVLTNSV